MSFDVLLSRSLKNGLIHVYPVDDWTKTKYELAACTTWFDVEAWDRADAWHALHVLGLTVSDGSYLWSYVRYEETPPTPDGEPQPGFPAFEGPVVFLDDMRLDDHGNPLPVSKGPGR